MGSKGMGNDSGRRNAAREQRIPSRAGGKPEKSGGKPAKMTGRKQARAAKR
jgi:hypothetical protein